MRDEKDKRFVQAAVDSGLSALRGDPQLARRIMQKESMGNPVGKKRLPLGLALAAALTLITVTALAAAKGWSVLRFLFDGQNREPPPIQTTNLRQEAAADGASLQIDSAVYDGRALAFDWYIENKKPDVPMYCIVDSFTANGVRLWTDGTDSFDGQWIPGLFSDGAWQDGEYLLLPEAAQNAPSLHIDMRVTLYRPIRPVWRMEAFQPEEAAALAEKGYYVIAEGEGFVGYDEHEKAWGHWFGGIPPEDMGGYQTEQLTVSFDVPRVNGQYKNLNQEAVYENEHCTAVYEAAQLTPLGLYLTLSLTPKDHFSRTGPMLLTDGEGNPLQTDGEEKFFPSVGEAYGRSGNAVRVAKYAWNGVAEQDLPDTISLTCFLSDGEMMVFPLRVRN